MISEKICYATLFVAEALTTWQYVEYLFSKKKPLGFLACSFICGYAILFAVSLLDNTTGNAIVFFIVNYFLIELNYQVSRKTALLHTALLCFVMVVSEILIALVISLFGYEFDAYTYNFSVMIVLIILSKLSEKIKKTTERPSKMGSIAVKEMRPGHCVVQGVFVRTYQDWTADGAGLCNHR